MHAKVCTNFWLVVYLCISMPKLHQTWLIVNRWNFSSEERARCPWLFKFHMYAPHSYIRTNIQTNATAEFMLTMLAALRVQLLFFLLLFASCIPPTWSTMIVSLETSSSFQLNFNVPISRISAAVAASSASYFALLTDNTVLTEKDSRCIHNFWHFHWYFILCYTVNRYKSLQSLRKKKSDHYIVPQK